MAVDNPPPPAQPAGSRPATTREIIQIAGAAIALVAVIFAGMSLVVSMTLAPMREELRLLREDSRLLRGEINGRFDTLQAETNRRFDEMNRRFDAMQTEMDRRFDGMQTEMNRRFDTFQAENQRQHDSMQEVLRLFEGRVTRLEEKTGVSPADAE